MIVLLPVNGVGSNKDLSGDDPKKTSQLEILTMGNIPKGDESFAAHVIFVWCISLACYIGIWWTYRLYTTDRAKYWFGRNDARCHSVLVRGIPKNMDEEGLKEWLHKYVPIETLAIHRVRACKGLKKKRKKLQKWTDKLDKADWIIENQKVSPRNQS